MGALGALCCRPSLPLHHHRSGSSSHCPPLLLAPAFPHVSSCSQWWRQVPPCRPWLVGWLPGPFVVICPPVLVIPSPSPPSSSSLFPSCHICSLILIFVPLSSSSFLLRLCLCWCLSSLVSVRGGGGGGPGGIAVSWGLVVTPIPMP